jgi:Tol biopolymer transport system component/DNA-binding winged helix-turn-helix (wHTH) protein
MPVIDKSYPIYRFSNFEVDTRSGELRRNGARVKLQEQPLQVLIKLVEHAGELVAREELRSTLWAADTFVDFDTGLNTAIKRLRETLGDSADRPTFIETVPKRGYRFIAPVISSPDQHSDRRRKEPSSGTRHRSTLIVGSAVAALLVAAALGALFTSLRGPEPRPTVTGAKQITSDGRLKGNLVTDGTSIFFNELLSDYFVIAQVPATGGETAVINATAPGWHILAVAPEKSELLVSSSKEGENGSNLWVMPVPAGSPRELIPGAYDGTWTPDGKIALVRGREIHIAEADGSNSKKILTSDGFPGFVRFSPDGKNIRFHVANDVTGMATLWESGVDGKDVHPLFAGDPETQFCCGSWTSDGRYYFFEGFHEGLSSIWALRESSSRWRKHNQPVQITTGPLNFYNPLPSKDGKKLFAVGAQPKAELVRYDARSKEFVPFLGGISAGDVEFSHDRQWVTYVRYPEGTLWKANADGTEAVQLTSPPLSVALAHWSPDDTHIAFSGTKAGQHWTVYQVAAQGGALTQLTGGKNNEQDPTWSPEGERLAFGQFQPLADSASATTEHPLTVIQMLDLRTGQIQKIAGSENICCPRWSPDGRFIVASAIEGNRLLLYELATGRWRDLSRFSGQYGYFAWSRDAKYVYYDTTMVKEPELGRVRVADGRVEHITSLKDVRRFWGPWGPWAGITPDGSPLIVRDISNQEIYALDLNLP